MISRLTVVSVIILFISVSAYAEPRTLLGGDTQIESGGYGAPVVMFSMFNEEFAVMIGAEGGWIINHQFVIGGGGYGLTTLHEIRQETVDQNGQSATEKYIIDFGYGGMLLSYIYRPNDLVHIYISGMIAGGGVSISQQQPSELDVSTLHNDPVFVLDPKVHFELNVTRWFRVGVGVGYRWVGGYKEYEEIEFKSGELKSWQSAITLKFGSF